MAKVPQANRAPGVLGQVVRAPRLHRAAVAALISTAAFWAGALFLPEGAVEARLVLLAVILWQLYRVAREPIVAFRPGIEMIRCGKQIIELRERYEEAKGRGEPDAADAYAIRHDNLVEAHYRARQQFLGYEE